MPLHALAPLFAAPTLTEAEDAAIDAAVATLADPDAEPVEIPTPRSCMIGVGDAAPVEDATPGEAALEPNRHALALLRDHLQREAVAAHLPVRFYIRERAEHEERGEAPAVEGRRAPKPKVVITVVPAAVIAARVKVAAPKA